MIIVNGLRIALQPLLMLAHLQKEVRTSPLLDHQIFEHITHEKFKQAIERDDTLNVMKKLAKKGGRLSRLPIEQSEITSRLFGKVSIDIAGPLNLTRSRNRFILTKVRPATRWPEAVPLKRISTREVAEALFGIFSRLGIPKYYPITVSSSCLARSHDSDGSGENDFKSIPSAIEWNGRKTQRVIEEDVEQTGGGEA
ncbi:Zinc finger protein [Plakobranchus ocellatus]|uniref:Zinc finger protein n=1 Tax=Plakobranchus ocellatus TaxID=259542 RepID=A0AAV3ZBP9_9GAST|nr:Zinc finger protein [Plakobranchus ocellatus]